VAAYKDRLIPMRDRVAKLARAKKSLEQIKEAKPLADWDKFNNNFIQSDVVVEMIHHGLLGDRPLFADGIRAARPPSPSARR
jgi:hypothetical protein